MNTMLMVGKTLCDGSSIEDQVNNILALKEFIQEGKLGCGRPCIIHDMNTQLLRFGRVDSRPINSLGITHTSVLPGVVELTHECNNAYHLSDGYIHLEVKGELSGVEKLEACEYALTHESMHSDLILDLIARDSSYLLPKLMDSMRGKVLYTKYQDGGDKDIYIHVISLGYLGVGLLEEVRTMIPKGKNEWREEDLETPQLYKVKFFCDNNIYNWDMEVQESRNGWYSNSKPLRAMIFGEREQVKALACGVEVKFNGIKY